MALVQVCAVFDSAMQAHAQPMFVPADGVAMRGFTNEINRQDAQNQLYMHPDDFELWHLAQYNEETGEFHNERRLLARAKDLKSPT